MLSLKFKTFYNNVCCNIYFKKYFWRVSRHFCISFSRTKYINLLDFRIRFYIWLSLEKKLGWKFKKIEPVKCSNIKQKIRTTKNNNQWGKNKQERSGENLMMIKNSQWQTANNAIKGRRKSEGRKGVEENI